MKYILRQIMCKVFGHHRRPYYMHGDTICRRCDAVVIQGARTRGAHLKFKEASDVDYPITGVILREAEEVINGKS